MSLQTVEIPGFEIVGKTVFELLSRRGAMPWETAARVALSVAESLAYAKKTLTEQATGTEAECVFLS